jgi:hypothetical protein
MDDSERTYGYSEDIYHGAHDKKDEKSYEYGAENAEEVEGEALSPEEAAMHVEGPRLDATVESTDPGTYDYGRNGEYGTTESFTWDLSTDETKPAAQSSETSAKDGKKKEPSLAEQRLEPAKREP